MDMKKYLATQQAIFDTSKAPILARSTLHTTNTSASKIMLRKTTSVELCCTLYIRR